MSGVRFRIPKSIVNLSVFLFFLHLVPIDSIAGHLSLEDCVRMAKEHNPALKTARWETAITLQQTRLADSAIYPRIDFQGGYTAQLEAQAVKYNNQAMQMQQPAFGFASLAIYQTIYDFGRRDSRISQSKTAEKVVESGIRAKEQDVAMQVVETYFGILQARKLADAARDELSTVNEHRKTAGILYDNGVVTRNDLLQADVRIASVKQKILAIETTEKHLMLILNYLSGRKSDEDQTLIEPSDHEVKTVGGLSDDSAVSKRPDIEAIRRKIEISEYEVVDKKGYFFPEIFARLNLDYLQNDRMKEQAIYGATVGLRINIFDGFATTASFGKAVASRSLAREQLRQFEEQARMELQTAENDAAVSRERIGVASTSVAQAMENLRINLNRYQERAGTATEVMDAQTLLSQAKSEYYRAWYDFQVSLARIRKAKGLL